MRLRALVGAVLFLASCSKQKQIEPVVQVVRAGVVEEIQPSAEERYSVSIEPFEKVDLAFKSGGIVENILHVRGADGRMRNVQAGDKVARNAELAQVRSLDYQHALEQTEAQHAQAQAQWARRRRNGAGAGGVCTGAQTSTRPLNMRARIICSTGGYGQATVRRGEGTLG